MTNDTIQEIEQNIEYMKDMADDCRQQAHEYETQAGELEDELEAAKAAEDDEDDTLGDIGFRSDL